MSCISIKKMYLCSAFGLTAPRRIRPVARLVDASYCGSGH